MNNNQSLEKTFEQVVQHYGNLIARIASSYEFRPDLQQELTQECLSAIWKALPSFQQRASIKTFVARIAHNVCITHVRRESKYTSTELPDVLPDQNSNPEQQLLDRDLRTRLLDTIRALPVTLRQVVTLHLEGFTGPEIGDTLGLETGNVAVRLSRARAALKQRMENQL